MSITMARRASDKASSVAWRGGVQGTMMSPSSGVLAHVLGEAGEACALCNSECRTRWDDSRSPRIETSLGEEWLAVEDTATVPRT